MRTPCTLPLDPPLFNIQLSLNAELLNATITIKEKTGFIFLGSKKSKMINCEHVIVIAIVSSYL